MQRFVQHRRQVFLYAALASILSAAIGAMTLLLTLLTPAVQEGDTTYVFSPTILSERIEHVFTPTESPTREVALPASEPTTTPTVEPTVAPRRERSTAAPPPQTGSAQVSRPRLDPSKRAVATRDDPVAEDYGRDPAPLVFRHVAQ